MTSAADPSDTLLNVVANAFEIPEQAHLEDAQLSTHKPRILLLYGSLRERSFSRFLTLEAERLLHAFGAETRVFDPRDLPLPDSVPDTHPKVQELRALAAWSQGQVWCSPERHGAMTGIIKAQIDWMPLTIGAVRCAQRKAKRLPSCRFRPVRSLSMTSISCEYLGDG